MASPFSETIVDYVVEKLSAIAIADDYEFDVSVKRAVTGGVPHGDENVGVVIVVWSQMPTDAHEVAPLTLDGYRMQIMIEVYLHFDINDPEQPANLAKINADIIKAFSTDYTLDNQVHYARFSDTVCNGAAIAKTLEVTFFTARADPYTAA